jgi:hypothetical protein
MTARTPTSPSNRRSPEPSREPTAPPLGNGREDLPEELVYGDDTAGGESQGRTADEQYDRSARGDYGDEDADPSYADPAYASVDAAGDTPLDPLAGTGEGRRTDVGIREEILELLPDVFEIDANDVAVTVVDGLVTLEGAVDSEQCRDGVEGRVVAIAGVRGVENRLFVRGG